jgi:hypothetical protein
LRSRCRRHPKVRTWLASVRFGIRVGYLTYSAVGAGGTAGGAGTLSSDTAENTRHSRSHARRGRLEVLVQLGRVGGGGASGGAGKSSTVGQSIDGGGAPGGGAVRLNSRASGNVVEERAASLLGGSTVNAGADDIGAVGKATSVRKLACGLDVEAATDGEVVKLSKVKGSLERLASGKGLEVVLGEVLVLDHKTDTLESDLGFFKRKIVSQRSILSISS